MYANEFEDGLISGLIWLLTSNAVIGEYSTIMSYCDTDNNIIPVEVFIGPLSSEFVCCLN